MYYYIIALVMNMKLRIRDMREDNDLTQQKIADILLCDQSLYSKYERGEREIPLGARNSTCFVNQAGRFL